MKKSILFSIFFLLTQIEGKTQTLSAINVAKMPFINDVFDNAQRGPLSKNAVFIAGKDALQKYIWKHQIYPDLAKEYGIEGVVRVSFKVATDGHIGDIHVVKSLGFGCDEAAIKLIQQMPNWESAQLNGVPTESLRYLEFRFNLL